jgi:hypothetical protein
MQPRPRARLGLVLVLGLTGSMFAAAQHDSVIDTVHNLSVSGPGEVRALSETEICVFCHVPHNALAPRPLWGHTLSSVPQYDVPTMARGSAAERPAPQPDGASRLCLSCHDGTVALGDVGGTRGPIQMVGPQRLGRGQRGYIGTDLSGSHPISFVVPDGDPTPLSGDRDMGLKPLAVIVNDGQVQLDHQGKMQCTTCHDPHRDRFYIPGVVPRFWVKASVEEVCLTCHELR